MLRGYTPDGQGTGGYSVSGGVALSTLVTGLVSYWSLDQPSGTRADSVGSADLTDNNTVGSDTGKNGNAASFVAANSESLSTTTTFPPSEADFSVSGWIKPTATSGVHIIFASGNGTGAGEWQLWQGGDFVVELDSGGSVGAGAASTDWQHVFLSYTTADKKLAFYCNNVLRNTATGAGTGAYGAGKVFSIGKWADGSYCYDGLIDEVGFWSRVLTEDERTELYNSGPGKFYNGTNFV